MVELDSKAWIEWDDRQWRNSHGNRTWKRYRKTQWKIQ
jgi:hypothetical protein